MHSWPYIAVEETMDEPFDKTSHLVEATIFNRGNECRVYRDYPP